MKQISQSKVVGTEAAPAPLSLDLVLLPVETDEVEDEEPEAFLCGGMTLEEIIVVSNVMRQSNFFGRLFKINFLYNIIKDLLETWMR